MVEGAGGKVGVPHKNSARDCPRRWQVRPGWRSWVITAGLGERAEFLDVVGRAVEFETRDRLVVEIPETSALIDAAEPAHSPRPSQSTRTATHHRPLTEHMTAPAHLRDQRRLMAPFERIPVAPPYISRYLDPALPVVDVGSGNGRCTRWLASRFPAAVGVDVASAAVTRARDESDGTANAHGARRTDPRLPSGARREGSPLTRHPTQATRHPTCGNCLPGGTGRAGRGPLQLCWLPVIGHLRAASGASHAGLSATPAPDC